MTAFMAGLIDFLVMTLWTEAWLNSSAIHGFFHLHAATTGTALGAMVGAVTNFLLNRHWAFRAKHLPLQGQALRYGIVSGLSLGLNVTGVYFLSEKAHWFYLAARFFTAVMVAVFFNYPLHRYFVFRVNIKESLS
jgi:putative flippase GtrA